MLFITRTAASAAFPSPAAILSPANTDPRVYIMPARAWELLSAFGPHILPLQLRNSCLWSVHSVPS